ncbi:hypothetical protein CEXT_59581 [Caerostris extrusa]|uniref:Uncharacterized protein n=1 Tax=Caerostris extrusa TaxID=172846 RepID=A0AAV4QSJ6_CAEEX|nr:hypothetical protein CEXT_59581 [Caerostris extrusa]
MHKVLNLDPVHSSDGLVKLRHDTLEIQVHKLKSLHVKPEAYGSMLNYVTLRILPSNITLEAIFNRINIDSSSDNFENY